MAHDKIYLKDSTNNRLKLLTTTQQIKWYLCGPTVYQNVHLGNVRSVIVNDVLHRFLLSQKYQINYVHNITDMDNEIVKQSQIEGATWQETRKKYFYAYLEILVKLNVLAPTQLSTISEHIKAVTTTINLLVNKQLAYYLDDGIYFDGNAYLKRLKQFSLSEQTTIFEKWPKNQALNHERSALDFPLWKFSSEGYDSSKIGFGQPTIDSECIAIIDHFFNDNTLNLYSGGIDLKQVHHFHEQQLAYALHKTPLTNIWWHIGLVKINGNKMAKSLNNTISVNEFLTTYDSNTLRYLFLNASHETDINLNLETIKQAHQTVLKYQKIINQYQELNHQNPNLSQQLKTSSPNLGYEIINNALSNNLNTKAVLDYLATVYLHLVQTCTPEKYDQIIQSFLDVFIYGLKLLGFEI